MKSWAILLQDPESSTGEGCWVLVKANKRRIAVKQAKRVIFEKWGLKNWRLSSVSLTTRNSFNTTGQRKFK